MLSLHGIAAEEGVWSTKVWNSLVKNWTFKYERWKKLPGSPDKISSNSHKLKQAKVGFTVKEHAIEMVRFGFMNEELCVLKFSDHGAPSTRHIG